MKCFDCRQRPGVFNVSYVASRANYEDGTFVRNASPSQPLRDPPTVLRRCPCVPRQEVEVVGGMQTTTGPVVISKQGMLNDLGVGLPVLTGIVWPQTHQILQVTVYLHAEETATALVIVQMGFVETRRPDFHPITWQF